MVAVCHLLDSGVRPEGRHADAELRQRRRLRDLRPGAAVRQPADHAQPQPHLVERLARRRAKTASSCAAPARCGRRWPRPSTSSTSTRPARTWCRSGSIRRSTATPRSPARCRGRGVHLVMPAGLGSGHAADPARRACAAPRRRARRWWSSAASTSSRRRADLAIEVALDFLGHFGLIDREVPPPAVAAAPLRAAATHVIQARRLRLRAAADRLRDLRRGRADRHRRHRSRSARLCDDCTIFMPARRRSSGGRST